MSVCDADAAPAPDLYLGTHETSWLARPGMPVLFVSDRRLARRRRLPVAAGPWILDSGGYTELHQHGGWQTTPAQYAARVRRYAEDVGRLRWVAPQDWMCEPSARDRTGLTVADHQARTVHNFGELRARLGQLVVPVLQGWELGEHVDHVDQYAAAGVDLSAEPIIGVGSICRRDATDAIGAVLESLAGLRLHAFGVKGAAFARYGSLLVSADSMAWSYAARREPPLPSCSHRTCANCPRWALAWRANVLAQHQPRLPF